MSAILQPKLLVENNGTYYIPPLSTIFLRPRTDGSVLKFSPKEMHSVKSDFSPTEIEDGEIHVFSLKKLVCFYSPYFSLIKIKDAEKHSIHIKHIFRLSSANSSATLHLF